MAEDAATAAPGSAMAASMVPTIPSAIALRHSPDSVFSVWTKQPSSLTNERSPPPPRSRTSTTASASARSIRSTADAASQPAAASTASGSRRRQSWSAQTYLPSHLAIGRQLHASCSACSDAPPSPACAPSPTKGNRVARAALCRRTRTADNASEEVPNDASNTTEYAPHSRHRLNIGCSPHFGSATQSSSLSSGTRRITLANSLPSPSCSVHVRSLSEKAHDSGGRSRSESSLERENSTASSRTRWPSEMTERRISAALRLTVLYRVPSPCRIGGLY